MSEPRVYRSRPKEITAVEVPAATYSDAPDGEPLDVVDLPHVKIRDLDGDLEVWNGLHASWIGFKPGDFLRVDTPGDVYPIDRETFEATYDPVDEG